MGDIRGELGLWIVSPFIFLLRKLVYILVYVLPGHYTRG